MRGAIVAYARFGGKSHNAEGQALPGQPAIYKSLQALANTPSK